VSHPTFHLFIFISIILNTMVLCYDYYDINTDFKRPGVFEYTNYIFMCIFTLEVILKLIGLGCKEFVIDRFNLFDTLVVFFSILELLLSDGGGATSALRAFRLFRIFKIFRVGNLRIMLDSLSQTIMSIGNYVILLVLFIYVFALMGMQFFAGKLKLDADGNPDSNGKSIRYNFDTIDITFLTIFNLLLGDNWNETMYDAMRCVSELAAIYFITIVIIGSLVMINLLIAIIINNFDMSRYNSNKRRMTEELKKHIDAGEDTFTAIEIILGEKVALKAFGLKAKPIVETKKPKKKSLIRCSTVKNLTKHVHLNDYK
jgi:voltage-dependent calcium channel L type alpha-1D